MEKYKCLNPYTEPPLPPIPLILVRFLGCGMSQMMEHSEGSSLSPDT